MSNRGQRDRYGGNRALQFEATGFFRLEKADRWWLVTPEGNAFLSFGINHIEPHRTTASYNKEFWANEFGVPVEAEPDAFHRGVLAKAKKDLALLGMNTLGCHTPPFYGDSFMPYVGQFRCFDICHYMVPTKQDYPDVFAPEFVNLCDEKARAVALPHKDDPHLLGYSMIDCPIFTNLDAAPRIENVYGSRRPGLPLWPVVLRNLAASAPGKQAYVAFVRERYGGDIRTFNNVYDTSFAGFDDLRKARNWRPSEDNQNAREVEDDLQFLYRIVDRCYQVEVAAIRKFDTNHLIFGDKLNGNSNTPDQIVRLADKHMDLIFYQYYALLEDQVALLERWTRLTDKPFFMGDSSLSVPSVQAPDPYGPHCRSQEDRAERFTRMFNDLFSRPRYVGWSWCGWMDSWKDLQDNKQHSGLQTPFGAFHEPMRKAMAEFSANMYTIATQ